MTQNEFMLKSYMLREKKEIKRMRQVETCKHNYIEGKTE